MSVTGKRILITGGAGFIGSTLCERLVEDNEIVVYDNEYRNALRYTTLESHKNLSFVRGDVLSFEQVRKAIDGCNMVIHLAAIAGVPDVFRHPVMTMQVPLIGTYNALEAAMQVGGIERFIDFSTSEVFGSYAFRVQ